MSALAEYLLSKGKSVSGSDRTENEQTDRLKKLGSKIFAGHYSKNVNGSQAVVYTSAINDDNPELKFAKKHGIPLIKRSELLSEALNEYKTSICVAGSHGKTTCTAMLSRVLKDLELSPTAFIGGEDVVLGNFHKGDGDFVVCEACEYKRNFLNLQSKIKIALNIDNDHLDSFGSMENAVKDFRAFVKNSVAFVNADDENCKSLAGVKTYTFGIEGIADYTAKRIKKKRYGIRFAVYKNDKKLGGIKLFLFGKHNVYNALAVVGVCDYLGLDFKSVSKSIESFRSVKRRSEYLGKFGKTAVYADYAHHPKEIEAVLTAFGVNGKDAVIFQPHTYSRTKILINDFVRSLKNIKNLAIYKTFSAREKDDYSGSESKLCLELSKKSDYVPALCLNEKELFAFIKTLKGKKRVFVLGAGDIYYSVKNFLADNSIKKK